MSHMIYNQIRRLRKCAGLTQKELAYLTGLDSTTSVSRIERSLCTPNLVALLALQCIFRRSSEQLLPELTREVERMVIIRANTLCRTVMQNRVRDYTHKHKVLSAIINHQTPVERAALWTPINIHKK
ncbi:MAG: helix-turn-helix domain-containing protein [Candidatus Thiodiazotropha sp. (ex Lucinoma borealis)]|nr:helix-turn-helix domain-containing protein [Candidatus Thiodiazotropha sp. (ex Lucinoma borealis)]